MTEPLEILRVLVGSRAHGLETEDSDFDYRGVFVVPTSDLLKLGSRPKETNWVEGDVDSSTYELGHFLQMATKSNPSVLEVFKAPYLVVSDVGEYDGKFIQGGHALRALFPKVWSSRGVYDAFRGYSHNQQTKFLSDKIEFTARRWKYAVAKLRVLLQGIELLHHGDFEVKIHHHYPIVGMAPKSKYLDTAEYNTNSWATYLRAVKKEVFTTGQIMDTSEALEKAIGEAYNNNKTKETELEAVNEYLLMVRRAVW